MADKLTIENWPDSGSPERVAYDLMRFIRSSDASGQFMTKKDILTLYADCLKAAKGYGVKD